MHSVANAWVPLPMEQEPPPLASAHEREYTFYLRVPVSKLLSSRTIPKMRLDEKVWTLLKNKATSPLLKGTDIHLPHISPQTFVQVLHFVTKDTLNLNVDNIQNIWVAALSLEMKKLQKACIEWVKEQIQQVVPQTFQQQQHAILTFLPWFPILRDNGDKIFCEEFIVQFLNKGAEIGIEFFSQGVDLFKSLPIEELKDLEWSTNYQPYLKKLIEFKSLKTLTLPFFIVREDLETIKHFSMLKELRLLNCSQLSPSDLAILKEKEYMSLEKLTLEGLSLTFQSEEGMKAIKKLPLKEFEWKDGNFFKSLGDFLVLNDSHLKLLENMPLEKLSLIGWGNLSIDGEGFFNFRSLTHLKSLWLASCKLKDSALAVLYRSCPLKELYLTNIPFSPYGLRAIARITSLTSLGIEDNDILELNDLQPLLMLSDNLNVLELNRCKKIEIRGEEGATFLSKFSQLVHLSLQGCKIIDVKSFVDFLKKMPKLETVYLDETYQTQIDSEIVFSMGKKIFFISPKIVYSEDIGNTPGLYRKSRCKNASCLAFTTWEYMREKGNIILYQSNDNKQLCDKCKNTKTLLYPSKNRGVTTVCNAVSCLFSTMRLSLEERGNAFFFHNQNHFCPQCKENTLQTEQVALNQCEFHTDGQINEAHRQDNSKATFTDLNKTFANNNNRATLLSNLELLDYLIIYIR